MRKCNSCKKYANDPILGHFRCSYHRDCAGKTQWTPELCDVCLKLREEYAHMPKEERDIILPKLRDMLKRMHSNLAQKHEWEFRKIANAFLREQIPPTSTRSVESGEISPDQQPQQEKIAKSPKITQNTDFQMPAVPEGLFEMFTQMVGQVGDLSQAVTQMQYQLQEQRNQETFSEKEENRYDEASPDLPNSQRSPSFTPPSFLSDSFASRNFRQQPRSNSEPRTNPEQSTSPKDPKENRKQFFLEDDETFIYTNKDHKFVGNKVMIDNQLKYFKWHSSGKAFCIVKTSSAEASPYMLPSQAHETLVSFCKAATDVNDKTGNLRRCYRTHFDSESGLAEALNIIKSKSPSALHSLYKDEDFTTLFPKVAFRPVSVVNFSSGWSLTSSDYMKWAKFENLDMKETSLQLKLPYTPFVHKEYLEKEKLTRSKIVDTLSGLSMLESATKSIKNNTTLVSVLEATSRHFLSFLKDAVTDWIAAKFDVRKIVLQGSTAPGCYDLLISDIWDASLFPSAIVAELKAQDTDIKSSLELSRSTNFFYTTNPNKARPAALVARAQSPPPR